jgi:ankyrin repeat protein
LIGQSDDKGLTLLHHSIKNFQYRIARFLLDHAADPNAIASDGSSPLGICGKASSEDLAFRKTLISKGAKYTELESIREMIAAGENDKVIREFKLKPQLVNSRTPKAGPFLHAAVWLGSDASVVTCLLEMGVNPNVTDENGTTALHLVMARTEEQRKFTPDIMRALIRHGADVNRRDNDGVTPLHRAAADTSLELVTLLIENGAKINAKTNDGHTALDIVYEMKFVGYRSLAHYLKSKGARSGK